MGLQGMVEVVVNGIYDGPDPLLCAREDREFCSRYRQPTIDHIRHNLRRI